MPLKKPVTAAEIVVPAQAIEPPTVHTAGLPKADAPKPVSHQDALGRRISRQGLFQAALQSPALMQYAPTLDDYIVLVVRTANAGLAYVNE